MFARVRPILSPYVGHTDEESELEPQQAGNYAFETGRDFQRRTKENAEKGEGSWLGETGVEEASQEVISEIVPSSDISNPFLARAANHGQPSMSRSTPSFPYPSFSPFQLLPSPRSCFLARNFRCVQSPVEY